MAESSNKNAGERDSFPAGLRVLAVDDNPICLKWIKTLLQVCQYNVTVAEDAVKALKLLRENQGSYDIVITDVRMPYIDGFKLLEIIGLEMDLPVIMMSSDSEVQTVMKGIIHGACDYLVKPVRLEEVKVIWQHVIRKSRHHKEVNDATSTVKAEVGSSNLTRKVSKKKREDESNDNLDEDLSTFKKPRMIWSKDMHLRFLMVVHQLGINNAQPKQILEAMNVQGLTQEIVTTHLEKYRKNMQKCIGVGPQPSSRFHCHGLPSSSLSSFNEQDPYIHSVGAPKFNRYHNYFGKSVSGDGQHSRDGLSWSLFPMNFSQKPISDPKEAQVRLQCRNGPNSLVMKSPYPQSQLSSLDYQSLNPRPIEPTSYTDYLSQNAWLAYRDSMATSSVTQLGEQYIKALFDSSNSRHDWQQSRAELNAALLPMHRQHSFGSFNEADFLLGMKNNGVQSNNKENVQKFGSVDDPPSH